MNIQNSLNQIDQLGSLMAEIAVLTKQADVIKAKLKSMGPGDYEGALFDANVAAVESSESPDPKAMEEKLIDMGVDGRWFSKNMKTRAASVRVTVRARKI